MSEQEQQQKQKYPRPFELSSFPEKEQPTTATTVSNNCATVESAGIVNTTASEIAILHPEMTPKQERTSKRMKNETTATTTSTTPHSVAVVASKGIAMAQKSIHDFRRKIDNNNSNDIDDMDGQKQPGRNLKEEEDDDVFDPTSDQKILADVDINNNASSDDMVVDVLSTYLTEDVIVKIMNFCTVSDLVHGIGMTNHYYHDLSGDCTNESGHRRPSDST